MQSLSNRLGPDKMWDNNFLHRFAGLIRDKRTENKISLLKTYGVEIDDGLKPSEICSISGAI